MRRLRTVIPLVALVVAPLFLYWPFVSLLLFHARLFVMLGVGGDEWLYVYLFRAEAEKLMGLDHGGLWNGGFYYPLHEISLLMTEQQWGVSLALFPIWLVTRDEFVTLGAAAVGAMIAGWIAAFGFARHLGASRPAAMAASVAFGTSGVFLALLIRPFFWPFALVVLLLVVTDLICLSRRRLWISAFAVLSGILAWSSAHLTVMGMALVLAQAGFCFASGIATPGAVRRLLVAAAAAVLLVAVPFVPQYVALRDTGFERSLDAQALNAANLSSFLLAPTRTGGELAKLGLPPPKGEVIIGLPALALLFATGAFVVSLARSGGRPTLPKRSDLAGLVAGALPGIIIAVAVPARAGMLTMNRLVTAIVYAALGAAIVLARKRIGTVLKTPAGWFFACAVLFATLSVGPVFKLDDESGIPSPAMLLCRLPGFSGIRASTRWSIVCAFCLAISTAMALDAVRMRKLKVAATLAFVVLMAFDAWRPAPPAPPPPPGLTEAWRPRSVDVFLRDAAGDGPVLELPVTAAHSEAERMISRLFHRRPLVNGYSGTIPRFHAEHWIGPTAQLHELGTLDERNVDLLRAFGARFWVLHVDLLRPEVRASVPAAFGPLQKIATLDDGRVLVYEDPVPQARLP